MDTGEDILIRDAAESDLAGLLGIQKSAFMRYTEFLLPEQMPPLTETSIISRRMKQQEK